MGAETIKPLASLNGALLGRRIGVRRVPLSFGSTGELAIDPTTPSQLPEVVQQVVRLAEALGVESPVDYAPVPQRVRVRVAFTLRLDPVRHQRLRQIAALQSRSAQQVLTDALDLYSSGVSTAAMIPATMLSPRKSSTGTKP